MHIIHTESSCGWGGQEIRILTESVGMIERGHKIEIWSPENSNIYSTAQSMGIPTYPIQINKKSLLQVINVRNKISTTKPDIINTHSSTDSWIVSIACKTLPNPPPHIRTRHISAGVNNNFATKWLYNNATKHIVCTGDALKNNLINDNGISAKRITSIPTGVDISKFKPGISFEQRKKLHLPLDKHIVGIVATLRSWKGHDILLDAIPLLSRDDILFIIVGDGPRREHLLDKATKMNIKSNKLLFVGQQQDVVPWFQSMDIAILPSYANEGVPQSLMQAMACGIPVISTPVGSISELVIDNTTGILINKNSPMEIASAINNLIDDHQTQQRLAEEGLSHIKKNYTIEIMIDKMENIFNRIVEQYGK